MSQSALLIDLLKECKSSFGHVVPFDPAIHRLKKLDFTEHNTGLTDDMLHDTVAFTHYIHDVLEKEGAEYGIGGYNEHRTIYSRSHLFDGAAQEGTEPRRLHLGIDVWGKPHTKVICPLEGTVHSFGFNPGFGDYGGTIILSHKLGGLSFHTLYGHLSLASTQNWQGGERVQKGDVIGEFGIPQENGNWPPHVHFQVIQNIQGMRGDYPGVCRFSERAFYLDNCPDPDLILGMMKYAN
jgi:peptidoglycan LD-endopeptidase LytH